jgi:hypothetical protein
MHNNKKKVMDSNYIKEKEIFKEWLNIANKKVSKLINLNNNNSKILMFNLVEEEKNIKKIKENNSS